ncbi:chromosome segregation protein SMC [Hahella sp. KA22]|uniref:chromosome segregation protein SMC n=1 Tax=Hahella sp. KA22 TaxID=1628392 RepID=UPI000FDE2F24|nr:chromosome segregation protein SMC [Hahella sp. KA22]AZZ91369.1 chromosome segregation protein SMC [Hahella sp. KA22]QAY54739.1 chromosome segregation protein SMC [Hahella sp. KA22]
MRLKSIKLAGFKSFVDPTTVHFPSNMAAVVGPNGCGKSNIIDAVRWVMGESSAKHLRGESMTDVIFNGSNTRKPVGQASIELIFDNAGGVLQGEFSRYNEISVKRKVTRDAQSLYFLNGNKCRRKDITDLFLGTGLGPRSYAIIEQGMISRLIESKPEELRVFIEEAAGISKYKERRKETESRMKRTRENLERLSDIREELDRQLQHLHRQAKAAERYKELKAEERDKRALLNALKWRTLDKDATSVQEELRGQEVELERLLYERTSLDSRLEGFREKRADANEAVNRAQADYYGSGAEIAKLEQQIRNAKEREQQLQAEMQQLQETNRELNEELEREQQHLQELEEELMMIEPELEEHLARSEESTELLAQAEDAMQLWQQEWDDFSRSSAHLQKTAEVEQSRIQQAEKLVQQLMERKRKLADEQSLIGGAYDDEDLEILRERMLELEMHADQQALTHQEMRAREQSEQERKELLNARINDARTREQTLKGEQASLLALQKHDSQASRQEALEWLALHEIDNAPTLGERLSVAVQWEPALEAVLGARLSARVVSREFLTRLQDAPPKGVALVCEDEIDSEALRFASASSVNSAVAAWLDGVRSADSFSAAIERRGELSDGAFFLTPDGMQVGQDWIMAPPAKQTGDGLLARNRRLAEIEQEMEEVAAQLASLSQDKETIDAALSRFDEERETLQKESVEINKQLLQTKSDLSAKEARREQVQRRVESIAAEIAEIQFQIDEEQMGLQESKGVWNAALMDLEGSVEKKELLLNRRDDVRQKLDSLRTQARLDREHAHQMQLRASALTTRRESIRQALEKSDANLRRNRERMQWVEESLQTLQDPDDALQERLEGYLELRMQQEDILTRERNRLADLEQLMQGDESSRQRNEMVIQNMRSRIESLRMQHRETDIRKNALRDQMAEDQYDLENVIGLLAEDADEGQLQRGIEQIVGKVERLGAINLAAIEEYEAQSERKVYLDGQHEDLQEALETLENAIRKIDRETRNKFKETFDQVNEGLQNLFPRVFGGGSAYLELTGEDLLETGVAIMARPPGKKNSTIHLLSGGEKALTAIALIFSIFQLNPAPFCMLDEVDAPLDDANVGRYARMVKEMSDQVQFIYITHNKIAMEMADHLMGVTMHEPGVSRLVSVDVEEAAAMAAL